MRYRCLMLQEEIMDATYLVMCGMAWMHFGREEAGEELIRALSSPDGELRTLARTLLEDGGERSKTLVGEAVARRMLSAAQAGLCMFSQVEDPAWQGLPA